MLLVCCTIRCLRGGCIYKRVDVMAVHSHNINMLSVCAARLHSLDRGIGHMIVQACMYRTGFVLRHHRCLCYAYRTKFYDQYTN